MIVNLYSCHLQRKGISQGEKNKDSNKNNEFIKKYDMKFLIRGKLLMLEIRWNEA